MEFVRKAEKALTGKKDESLESTQSSNHGPHSSNLANKLDPRVDSDRDNRAAHSNVDDKHLGTAKDYGSGTAGMTDTTGHHKSNIANKLDPSVESTTPTVPATGAHGIQSGLASSGPHAGTTGATTCGSSCTNTGPRDINSTKKMDPRVDSGHDNNPLFSGAGNAPALGSTHGTHGPSSQPLTGTGATAHGINVGPHDSKAANKLDPRVDSDLDGRAAHQSFSGIGAGTTTHGSHTRDTTSGLAPGQDLAGSSYNTPAGTAMRTSGTTATAGPHDSSIANKLDPIVDSHVQTQGTQRKI